MCCMVLKSTLLECKPVKDLLFSLFDLNDFMFEIDESCIQNYSRLFIVQIGRVDSPI